MDIGIRVLLTKLPVPQEEKSPYRLFIAAAWQEKSVLLILYEGRDRWFGRHRNRM